MDESSPTQTKRPVPKRIDNNSKGIIAPPKPKAKKAGPEKAKASAYNVNKSADAELQSLKIKLAKAEKRKEVAELSKKIAKEEAVVIDKGQIANLPPTIQQRIEEVRETNVIFQPNEGPQTQFLAATEKEVLFGGARGGGKSYAMLVDPLRYVENKYFSGLLIRRTMPELRDLIHKSKDLYGRAFPKAKWKETEKEWNFPSGARIKFGYCESIDDTMQFQGQEFTWIGIDEAGQYPDPQVLQRLKGSLRSHPSLKTYVRLTANPGGPGQWWLKKMFVDPAPWNTRFTGVVEVNTPRGPIKEEISKRFIPSTVYDNPHLLHDNSYIAMLASLPEAQRKQWLEGNWDVTDNSAFPEWNKAIHVIEPFDIPYEWLRFRAADWGFSSPACCLWFAVDYDNVLYVYRELYATKMTADVFADKVLDLEWGEPIRYGVLDASCWAQRGDPGPSIAETMTRLGCRWRQSDRSPKSRIHGKLEVHRRLALGEDNLPKLRVFSTCSNLIRTLPSLPLDDNDVEDVDTTAEDHAYDALRYGCMSRPTNPSLITPVNKNNPTQSSKQQVADSVFGY